MNISIKALNLELTPALKDYAEKRLKGIVKFTEGDATIVVNLGKISGHHKQGEIFEASVNVTTPLGKTHYAVSQKADLYEAVDDIRNEIVRELTSAKGKRDTLFRRGAQKIKGLLKGLR